MVEGTLVGAETGLEIGGERRRMVERAGIDPHPLHPLAPGDRESPREQPVAMALAGKFGDQAPDGDQAFARLAKAELDPPHLHAPPLEPRMPPAERPPPPPRAHGNAGSTHTPPPH